MVEFKFSKEVSFDEMLNALIAEAKLDREQVNSGVDGPIDIDTKRAVATVVTKLEEARMWRRQARAFYDEGDDPL